MKCADKAEVYHNSTCICTATASTMAYSTPTSHAIIQALHGSRVKLHSYSLQACTIAVNELPCPMCVSALLQAHITTVTCHNKVIDITPLTFEHIK